MLKKNVFMSPQFKKQCNKYLLSPPRRGKENHPPGGWLLQPSPSRSGCLTPSLAIMSPNTKASMMFSPNKKLTRDFFLSPFMFRSPFSSAKSPGILRKTKQFDNPNDPKNPPFASPNRKLKPMDGIFSPTNLDFDTFFSPLRTRVHTKSASLPLASPIAPSSLSEDMRLPKTPARSPTQDQPYKICITPVQHRAGGGEKMHRVLGSPDMGLFFADQTPGRPPREEGSQEGGMPQLEELSTPTVSSIDLSQGSIGSSGGSHSSHSSHSGGCRTSIGFNNPLSPADFRPVNSSVTGDMPARQDGGVGGHPEMLSPQGLTITLGNSTISKSVSPAQLAVPGLAGLIGNWP